MDKLNSIKQWLSDNEYIYIDIPNESIHNIYNLLINGKFNEPNNDIEMLYYGRYYKIIKDYDNMRKYYLMAIEKGNSNAMNNLGVYYHEDLKDYDNMMKYYLMAVDNGNSNAMNNLGNYYCKLKDYDNMMKYYLMAIDKEHSYAMNGLGYYYKEVKDYDNMMKYYLMAIDNGNSYAMNNLGVYYKEIKDYTNMMKYFLMAIDNGNSTAMNNLGHYYSTIEDYDNMMKYYLMAIDNGNSTAINNLKKYINKNILNQNNYIQLIEQLDYNKYCELFENNNMAILLYKTYKSKIDLIELPFKYSPDNDGFIEAKNDFIKQIQNIEN